MGGCNSVASVKETQKLSRDPSSSTEYLLLNAAYDSDVPEVQRLLLGSDVDVVSAFEEALAASTAQNPVAHSCACGVVSATSVGQEQDKGSIFQRAPSDIIVQEQHLRRVRSNVKVNATVPATGNTALHIVAQNAALHALPCHTQLVQLLWACGADPNARNRQGKTPLHLLCESSRPKREDHTVLLQVIEALLRTSNKNLGAPSSLSPEFPKLDVDALEWNSSRQAPLHMATLTGDLDLIQLLVEVGGADVNVKNAAGLTPLHLTAKLNRTGCAMYLISRGNLLVSEPAVPATGRRRHGGENGQTALHIALLEGHTQMASLLIYSGAKVDAVTLDQKLTPLHLCARLSEEESGVEIVQLLLAGEANVDAKDVHGQTPLHHAVLQRNDDVGEVLVAVGKADIYARDRRGQQIVDLIDV